MRPDKLKPLIIQYVLTIGNRYKCFLFHYMWLFGNDLINVKSNHPFDRNIQCCVDHCNLLKATCEVQNSLTDESLDLKQLLKVRLLIKTG